MKRMLWNLGLLMMYAALTAFYAQDGSAWVSAIWGINVGFQFTTAIEAIGDWWDSE